MILRRIFCFWVLVSFIGSSIITPSHAYAAETILGLPQPGVMVNLSPSYQPVIIRGLTVHKDNPFLFDFIVDVGQDNVSGQALKKEGEKLIKYFLATLAVPDKDFWVNLSPYEKQRIIPDALGQTDMGRDLLEQDYILKQITASLIYPEKQLGKTFWDRVYAKSQKLYGTTQIPVNTFNKVWIMADRAEVFEHGQSVFVVNQHLKVMLEEDYLALQKHQNQSGDRQPGDMALAVSSSRLPTKEGLQPKAPQGNNPPTSALTSNIVREIVLPELEKEINTGKNFANLRQIFNSVILASWYKNNLKESLLNQVYADRSKIKGIDLNDPTIKEQIYEQYLKAYKKGVFNYIKEDVNNGQIIPRKYFSGGVEKGAAENPVKVDRAAFAGVEGRWDSLKVILAGFTLNSGIPDLAMTTHFGLSEDEKKSIKEMILRFLEKNKDSLNGGDGKNISKAFTDIADSISTNLTFRGFLSTLGMNQFPGLDRSYLLKVIDGMKEFPEAEMLLSDATRQGLTAILDESIKNRPSELQGQEMSWSHIQRVITRFKDFVNSRGTNVWNLVMYSASYITIDRIIMYSIGNAEVKLEKQRQIANPLDAMTVSGLGSLLTKGKTTQEITGETGLKFSPLGEINVKVMAAYLNAVYLNSQWVTADRNVVLRNVASGAYKGYQAFYARTQGDNKDVIILMPPDGAMTVQEIARGIKNFPDVVHELIDVRVGDSWINYNFFFQGKDAQELVDVMNSDKNETPDFNRWMDLHDIYQYEINGFDLEGKPDPYWYKKPAKAFHVFVLHDGTAMAFAVPKSDQVIDAAMHATIDDYIEAGRFQNEDASDIILPSSKGVITHRENLESFIREARGRIKSVRDGGLDIRPAEALKRLNSSSVLHEIDYENNAVIYVLYEGGGAPLVPKANKPTVALEKINPQAAISTVMSVAEAYGFTGDNELKLESILTNGTPDLVATSKEFNIKSNYKSDELILALWGASNFTKLGSTPVSLIAGIFLEFLSRDKSVIDVNTQFNLLGFKAWSTSFNSTLEQIKNKSDQLNDAAMISEIPQLEKYFETLPEQNVFLNPTVIKKLYGAIKANRNDGLGKLNFMLRFAQLPYIEKIKREDFITADIVNKALDLDKKILSKALIEELEGYKDWHPASFINTASILPGDYNDLNLEVLFKVFALGAGRELFIASQHIPGDDRHLDVIKGAVGKFLAVNNAKGLKGFLSDLTRYYMKFRGAGIPDGWVGVIAQNNGVDAAMTGGLIGTYIALDPKTILGKKGQESLRNYMAVLGPAISGQDKYYPSMMRDKEEFKISPMVLPFRGDSVAILRNDSGYWLTENILNKQMRGAGQPIVNGPYIYLGAGTNRVIDYIILFYKNNGRINFGRWASSFLPYYTGKISEPVRQRAYSVYQSFVSTSREAEVVVKNDEVNGMPVEVMQFLKDIKLVEEIQGQWDFHNMNIYWVVRRVLGIDQAALSSTKVIESFERFDDSFIKGDLRKSKYTTPIEYYKNSGLSYGYKTDWDEIREYISKLKAQGYYFLKDEIAVLTHDQATTPLKSVLLYNIRSKQILSPDSLPKNEEIKVGLHVIQDKSKNIIYLAYVRNPNDDSGLEGAEAPVPVPAQPPYLKAKVALELPGEEPEPALAVATVTGRRKGNVVDNAAFTRGGIDLNTTNGMQWKIDKDGNGVEMNIDKAMLTRIKEHGVDSLTPVIFKITSLSSVWSLVGGN